MKMNTPQYFCNLSIKDNCLIVDYFSVI
jgi:hypothetical protein